MFGLALAFGQCTSEACSRFKADCQKASFLRGSGMRIWVWKCSRHDGLDPVSSYLVRNPHVYNLLGCFGLSKKCKSKSS